MPKQMLAKGASISSEIQDSRFDHINTDPRFLLPSKKSTRTKIDKRFSRMLTDEDFYNSATVDRYGRKVDGNSKKKTLERLYLPADKEDGEDDEKDNTLNSGSDTDLEEENKSEILKNLKKDKIYDPARGGGFSSSEDEESDDEHDSEAEVDLEVGFPDLQGEQTTVEMGDISSRFAVVNLDWDNIKSVDLFAVFASFLPTGGKIHKISIYPSEFGKERMDREEVEGPPKEIFAKNGEKDLSEDNESEDDEKIAQLLQKPDDGAEYNNSALRQYQLERLRYFYAVVICSSPAVAQTIYEATDGREYLSSANFLDLRFIPDETEFEDKARDECTELPVGYRPTEFTTTALQHSKVKLTWDTEPNEIIRKEAINRAFSGAPSEINENDLQAYLGSDSESDSGVFEANDETPKLTKKDITRQEIRAALGLGADKPKLKINKSAGPVGDMEVTFTAGLSNSNENEVFQNKPIEVETTAEKYIRKEKERKARRKERAKARRENKEDLNISEKELKIDESKENTEQGFEDSFFASDQENKVENKPKSSQQKADRLARREEKIALAKESAAQRAQLELVMEGDDTNDGFGTVDHFDMNEILRAEKERKKKGKKNFKEKKRSGLQTGFEMDVDDPRFGKVFESHEYAIDPSNPRFKPTNAMKMLLEEGRRKRSLAEGNESLIMSKKRSRESKNGKELSGLIENVKKIKK
ncbi:Pre-rRNA-processing protein esf1 [Erysiphe neolycopersici]|uniref:Pre-rRNA-processing protein esf1 n=1 Tax=Erysiphe neolycopersici TaxID=212602 RepID=A0A420HSU3_9PEZI|nr:Pre-rRNA-processing protein esf1 [Erysiphe neolycopersici]